MIDLIYCGGGNPRFYEIATRAGFLYGARLPCSVYGPLYFADQEFKAPDRARYMAAVAAHRPYMATVLDWERADQFDEVMDWASEISKFVNVVAVIPKVIGGVRDIPYEINGRSIRIGYSVPTKYGAAPDGIIDEIGDREVHLLGGKPQAQIELSKILNVASADGNYIQNLATSKCLVWSMEDGIRKPRVVKHRSIREYGIVSSNGPVDAFRLSCANVMNEWRRTLCHGTR